MRMSTIAHFTCAGDTASLIMGSWSTTVAFLVVTLSTVVISTPLDQRSSKFFEQQTQEVPGEIQSFKSSESAEPELNDIDVTKVHYTGAQVWTISVEINRWGFVSELEDKNLISIYKTKSSSVDALIQAHQIQEVKTALSTKNLPFNIVIEDLQVLIDLENPPLQENAIKPQKSVGHSMDWKRYHRLEDIHGFLDYLAEIFPDIASVQSIGKSVEGRDLKIIKISNGNPSNKAVFIDGGIHAREWISPATVTYFINQLAENFKAESDDIKNIDWYFLPVLNPDGYEYTHTTNRMWRKNRRPGPNKRCVGVDLNRNFGYEWGGLGTSADPCSDIYKGEKPFSEPESEAILKFFQSGVKFSAYLTYHSYGQWIFYPWGYDSVLPPDAAELDTAGKNIAAAIKSTGQDVYTVGTAADLLYPAAGGSDDWAKSFGVKYSYTIELNDQGKYGFALPSQYIEAVAKENLAGLRTLVAAIHEA
ncbi:carboxypeptidase B-like [Plodia interpunctella]|uniref:carboxypeptidase B-like n=1 Tax=Plodia interpunctella TaxID=58824 RepID=UPI0023676618|nr:carboxypeptidase B-like [Plodia interpunctella]